MKPQLLKVSSGPACSFSVRHDNVPFVNNHWHYHPEVELIYIKEGNGTQFIGDSIQSFNSGDVMLVGANLPHFWSFEDRYFSEIDNCPDIYVAHFCDNFWGNIFLDIPENLPLKNILEIAKKGIKLTGRTKVYIGAILEKMLNSEGSRKILLLHQALVTIANSDELVVLSSGICDPAMADNDNDRINVVYQYSLANYKRKIQLQEIAKVAYISPNSFCRYFKSKTKKTYSNFLIEIRVGMACKLLIENKISIKQVCYESGFYNFASFHKYFKLITHKTPLNYQKEFIVKNSFYRN
jgi:AraC-like DNA-binding protein